MFDFLHWLRESEIDAHQKPVRVFKEALFYFYLIALTRTTSSRLKFSIAN
jgi:hypothetical protein